MQGPESETPNSEPTAPCAHQGSATGDPSAFRPPTSDLASPPAPLTDNPLFWLALFGVFGLAAMFVIGPKYAVRQGGIETRFQNHQMASQWKGQTIHSSDAVEAARLPTAPGERKLLIPLAPLFAVLGVVVAILLGGLIWRNRKSLSPPVDQRQ